MFDILLDAMDGLLQSAVSILPVHSYIGLVDYASDAFATGPQLVATFIGPFVHLQLMFALVGVVALLEIGRASYAAYRLVLKLIPTAG